MAFPVEGAELTILDPAGSFFTSRYGALDSKPISEAVNEWVFHWSKQMPGAYVAEVFSDDLVQTFQTTARFVEWARAR